MMPRGQCLDLFYLSSLEKVQMKRDKCHSMGRCSIAQLKDKKLTKIIAFITKRTKKVFISIRILSTNFHSAMGEGALEWKILLKCPPSLYSNTLFTYKPTLSIQKTFYHIKPPSIFHLD